MLRLTLLGPVDLVDPITHARPDLGGTRNLALLVYLFSEAVERPVRRDTVATLLWPESEQKNARGSLNTAVHQLRAALGDVVIPSRGQEELVVDRSHISCDCFEFTELARSGRLEEAAALYRAEFAAGLIVKDSNEFDVWLSAQRKAWRDRFAAVLVKLYDAAVAVNDLASAVRRAEQLLDIAPEQDEPVRALLQLLVARGQHPAAISLFNHYSSRLAEAFDAEPPADSVALIEGLPKAQRIPTAERASVFQIATPTQHRRRSFASIAGIVVALVATGFIGRQLGVLQLTANDPAGARAVAPPKVAVIPFAFDNAAQRSATVLNDALQWRLRNVGFEVLNARGADTAALRNAAGASQTGLTFVVGGDVATAADASVVARLWLKDASSGRHLWDGRFTQKEPNAHLIATQLSEQVTKQIRKAAGNASELVADDARVSTESWRDVYKARERMEAAYDMRHAGAATGSAQELDYAEATLVELSQREPDWSLPWLLRARIAEARSNNAVIAGDARAGATQLERGIRVLDSVASRLHSEDVYEMRARLLYRRWIFGLDDVDAANRLLARAEADVRKALELGHERSDSYATLSAIMHAQGKYAESFVYARRAYDSNLFLRGNEEILLRLFTSALNAGDDASANRWCQELQKVQPGKWPAVICRIQLAGFAPQLVAVDSLESAIAHLAGPKPIRETMMPRLKAAYATALAQLGRTDSARVTLAAVRNNRNDPEVVLVSAFAYAALKDAARARALLQEYLSEYRGTRSTALHMRWLNQRSQNQTPLSQ